MKRRRYKAALPFALIVSLFLAFLAQRPADYKHVEIVRVIDGDTVEIKGGKAARYIGIDTPETRKKTEKGWVKASDPYGEEAKRLNEQLVLGKDVRLEFDVQKQDRYKRLLVHCFVKDGDKEVLVQAEILKNGLAYLYTFPPNVRYTKILVEALKDARANRRGVWSQDLTIASTDAEQYVGQRKIVEGKVTRARSLEKFAQLTLEGLKVVIFRKDLEIFLNEGISPASFYKGKNIRVFGMIKEYKGEPEIIVSHPTHIEVVDVP